MLSYRKGQGAVRQKREGNDVSRLHKLSVTDDSVRPQPRTVHPVCRRPFGRISPRQRIQDHARPIRAVADSGRQVNRFRDTPFNRQFLRKAFRNEDAVVGRPRPHRDKRSNCRSAYNHFAVDNPRSVRQRLPLDYTYAFLDSVGRNASVDVGVTAVTPLPHVDRLGPAVIRHDGHGHPPLYACKRFVLYDRCDCSVKLGTGNCVEPQFVTVGIVWPERRTVGSGHGGRHSLDVGLLNTGSDFVLVAPVRVCIRTWSPAAVTVDHDQLYVFGSRRIKSAVPFCKHLPAFRQEEGLPVFLHVIRMRHDIVVHGRHPFRQVLASEYIYDGMDRNPFKPASVHLSVGHPVARKIRHPLVINADAYSQTCRFGDVLSGRGCKEVHYPRKLRLYVILRTVDQFTLVILDLDGGCKHGHRGPHPSCNSGFAFTQASPSP